jgi:hypothetical protein
MRRIGLMGAGSTQPSGAVVFKASRIFLQKYFSVAGHTVLTGAGEKPA